MGSDAERGEERTGEREEQGDDGKERDGMEGGGRFVGERERKERRRDGASTKGPTHHT
jgi:hypothetical protein